VSGGIWNNKKTAVEVKLPASTQGAAYRGTVKQHKLLKGGGSVSGGIWNNEKTAVEVKLPRGAQGENFRGHQKQEKLLKGGGSVSGKHWNNEQTAMTAKSGSALDAKAGRYSGMIALSRFKKTYVQNPNAFNGSLRKHPVKSSVKAAEYSRSMKQYWDYRRNPQSAKDALKIPFSGKATARVNDYQGNSKMHKYTGAQLHPDAQFAHSEHDNVKGERTLLMNVKLKWSKLFRKSETQPENLKEKKGKIRYDKREKGLWYD
jgi:hypothetical protein